MLLVHLVTHVRRVGCDYEDEGRGYDLVHFDTQVINGQYILCGSNVKEGEMQESSSDFQSDNYQFPITFK